MRASLVTAVTLVSSLASSGHTTFSATLECAEVAQALSIDVGDHPDHSLGVFQTKCTWVRPIEIRGTRSTAYTGTATLETQDSVSRLQGYGVIAFADGNSATFRFSGTSIQRGDSVTAQGTWTFIEGTGVLKGVVGEGVYKGRPAQGGRRIYSLSGAWQLPK